MNSVQVLYVCGCWQAVRVDLARGSTCQQHDAVPERINTHEWRVRCPRCRYGRWCGQDKERAVRLQSGHNRAYPTHNASVAYDRITYDGGGSILRWDGKRPRQHPLTDMLTASTPVRNDGQTTPPF